MSPIDEQRFKRYAERKRFERAVALERPTDDEILALYAIHTAPEIAEILRRPYHTVRMWIQEARTGRRYSEYRRNSRCAPQAISDTKYRSIQMLLLAEQRRIERRVNLLIATECDGLGFRL